MICELIIEGQRQGTVRRGDPSQMYYLLANASQVFTTPFEFKSLTGRNVFDSQEVESRINMLVGFFIV
jgi:hypothetical protein